jgi:hypothetical protein
MNRYAGRSPVPEIPRQVAAPPLAPTRRHALTPRTDAPPDFPRINARHARLPRTDTLLPTTRRASTGSAGLMAWQRLAFLRRLSVPVHSVVWFLTRCPAPFADTAQGAAAESPGGCL